MGPFSLRFPREMERLRAGLPLIVIFVVGLGLRTWHRDTVPKHNETIDEYAWAWSGMTLLRDGVPKAWSYLPEYRGVPWQEWRGWGYRIVRPWLDHPPLFSVVVGAWMVLGGYRDIFTVDLAWMRWVPWFLFIADFWVLVLLLRRYFSRDELLLGLAFFAVSPLVVVNQKLVICEDWLVLIYALTHLSLLNYDETRRKRYLAGVWLGAFALPFSKIAAMGLSLYLFMVALLRKNRALALAIGAGTALGLGAYLVWGAIYDWRQFLQVMHGQASRFKGFGGAFELLFDFKMVSTKFIYYPFYLGLFTVLFSGGRARELYLQYPIYIACMVFFVDENQVYGWYLIPMYPVLCMGVAQFVLKMIRDMDARYLFVWALFVLPYLFGMVPKGSVRQNDLVRYAYLAVMLALLGVGWLVRRPRVYAWTGGVLTAVVLACDVGYLLGR
jgi:hypothetical protein